MLYEELSKDIISAFYEVHKVLGFGFLENVYQNALYKELVKRGLKCECQKELDVYYKVFTNGACLNLSPLAEIESDMSNAIGCEYVNVVTHEQYAYPDYLAYQPDTRKKFMEMCRVFEKNGYEYIFIEELFFNIFPLKNYSRDKFPLKNY